MKKPKADHSESQEFLLSLIGGFPNGLISTDKDGNITLINEIARDYLSLEMSAEKLIGVSLADLMSEVDDISDKVTFCLSNEKIPFDIEVFQTGDQFLAFKGRAIQSGMLLTIEDISQLKAMESELLFAMLQGQEKERKRIAKELHDGFGPLLSAVKLNVESFGNDLCEIQNETRLKLENTIQLIDSIAEEMRSLSHDLMPKSLIDFGLKASIEGLCSRINKASKIQVNFFAPDNDERFDPLVEFGLYRITQELINNALKHSKANNLTIQLVRHDESILLMVEDDGQGFDFYEDKDKGIGLTNIEARTSALGGIFLLDSEIGKGVTATIEIPITNS